LGSFADAGFDGASLLDGAGFDGAGTRFFASRFAEEEVLRADFASFDFGLVMAICLSLCVNDSILCCHWRSPADRAGR
jgi:hypothetical protein